MSTSTTPRTPWILVLAGGLVMGLALGTRHVQGLFLLPITMERGWSRESFGLAMAVQNLTWGIAQPFAGMVADRFGSARVIAGGLLLYTLGLVAMVQSATPLAFLLSAGVCLGIALAGTAFGAVYGAISRLVSSTQLSAALGLTGAVGGLVQFALVPSVQLLLGRWGWGGALGTLALGMATLLPLALVLRERRPVAAASAAHPSMRQAIRQAFAHPGFCMLVLGFLACGFQLAFIATHLPAYLIDKGLRAQDGVAALAIIALANVLGTWAFGQLGGRWRRKHLLALIYLARSAAMALFVLLPLSTISLYLFAAVMGFLWLGTVPLTNGLVSQVFGVRYIATLFGFVFLGHQVGSFLGVWLGSYVFDTTRSYDLVWLGAMGVGVAAAALHWPIDDRDVVVPAGAKAPA